MALIIYDPRETDRKEFVTFWSARYGYSDEQLYGEKYRAATDRSEDCGAFHLEEWEDLVEREAENCAASLRQKMRRD